MHTRYRFFFVDKVFVGPIDGASGGAEDNDIGIFERRFFVRLALHPLLGSNYVGFVGDQFRGLETAKRDRNGDLFICRGRIRSAREKRFGVRSHVQAPNGHVARRQGLS